MTKFRRVITLNKEKNEPEAKEAKVLFRRDGNFGTQEQRNKLLEGSEEIHII